MPLKESVLGRRRAVARGAVWIFAALHILAISGLYLLPLFWVNQTYMSENALAPGQHHVNLSLALRLPSPPPAYGAGDIYNHFRDVLHLPTYRLADSDTVFSILYASRGEPSSCMAVSVHYNSNASVGYSMKLAQHLISAKWVGRDVIFLFSASPTDIQSWLHLYYSPSSIPLFHRSGPIQQALHFDFHSYHFRKVTVSAEGRNLPNLDLINCFVRSCSISRHVVTARKFSTPLLKKIPSQVAFFLQFFLNQLMGVGGSHSVFNSFAADSITIGSLGEGRDVSIHTLSDCIEGTLRSLQTLQESLHQSFYFYLLPSAFRYISIGDYMILFGLSMLVNASILAFAFLDPVYLFGPLQHNVTKFVAILSITACGAFGVYWFRSTFAYIAAVAVLLLFAKSDYRKRENEDLVFQLAFGGLFVALLVLSVISFPAAMVGSSLSAAHLLCWRLQFRSNRLSSLVLFLLLDPWWCLGNENVALIYVPFRLLFTSLI